jgi:hypothetical protein
MSDAQRIGLGATEFLLHRACLRGGRSADPRRRPRYAGRGLIRDIARPGDYVVLLGAGNITQWAYALPGELKGMG